MQPTALFESSAPRLMPDVGPTDETKNTDQSNEEANATGCSAHRGRLQQGGILFAATGTLGQRRQCPQVFSVSADKQQRTPSATATCSIGCVGISIPMMPARRSGSFAQRRGTGASRGPVGHGRGVGLFDAPRMESRPSVVSARRNTGGSTRWGSFARPLRRLMRGNGSSDPVAENGWRVPRVRCRASPPLASPGAARGVIRAPSRSRISRVAGAHSTGRSNTQMEPSRLAVCAIMALRRAAHLQR